MGSGDLAASVAEIMAGDSLHREAFGRSTTVFTSFHGCLRLVNELRLLSRS